MIIEVVAKQAFRVRLPPEAEPYQKSNYPKRRHRPPPLVEEIEGEANYVAESIRKSREIRT